MDRLICGEVGVGKAGIAVRAAFKAAANGKQVAVVVPTTILAFQHFKTFTQRLSNFPVTVDYINRFRSAAQQRSLCTKGSRMVMQDYTCTQIIRYSIATNGSI